LAGLGVLAESEGSGALVELEATARQLCRLVAVAATGNTIQNIAEAPRTETEQRRIDSAVRRGATPSQTARPVRGSSWGDRAEIWPATAGQEQV